MDHELVTMINRDAIYHIKFNINQRRYNGGVSRDDAEQWLIQFGFKIDDRTGNMYYQNRNLRGVKIQSHVPICNGFGLIYTTVDDVAVRNYMNKITHEKCMQHIIDG